MRFRFPRGARLAVLLVLVAAVCVPVAVAGAAEEVTPLAAAPSAENGELTAEVPNAWFVELEGKPTAAGGDVSTAKAQKQEFRDAARKAGVTFDERYAFDTLWNGLSLQVGAADASKLAALPGVKAIYPVMTVPVPRTETADPELATAIAMTGADIAQSELGLDGTGVRVAVMDTGIDVDHADLGGDGVSTAPHPFPNSRIVAGFDLVGDSFNADPSSASYNPTPSPDPVPDDCHGHGTHVAGIVGASGAVKGVAPGVSLGAYRVFGCEGSTTADIMIAAMERALADDMDILNMSIGLSFNTWPQYPTAAASDVLVDAGMAVVASIGNNGANGVYSAGAPGVGTKVTGVASYDNSHVSLNAFRITPDGRLIGYGNAASAPPAPTSGSLPMTKANAIGVVPPGVLPVDDGCAAVPAGTYSGQAVLIRRGTCGFHAKSLNAMNGGAAAVVLYNNVAGRFSPTVAGVPAITIPVVAISDAEGLVIHNFLAAGPVTLTWTAETLQAVNPTGGLISSFSSYGLNAELDVKPDIGAPGGLIRSTYPLENGVYATISGTSMSSPHVAGAAALFLEAKPGTDPLTLRSILQNSADPKNWSLSPRAGLLDHVHRQGAGMLDIDDSILAKTRITPGKLALGESQAGPQTRTLTLQNSGPAVTYSLSHVSAVGTHGSTFVPSFNDAFATVTFSAPTVAVPAGGSATVDVTIAAAAAPARGQYGGYIVLTPQGGGQTYRVPYAGLIGDYQSIVAMPATLPTTPATPNPRLAKLTACTPPALLRGLDCFGTSTYAVQSSGATFTMTNAFNVPNLLVHLDHQARRMEVEVLKATGKKVHPVFSNVMELDYLPRNSTSTSFFPFPWDGNRLHDRGRGNGDHFKVIPDGQYKVVVKVLKALGDPGNPAHWETWTSPTLTIDRP